MSNELKLFKHEKFGQLEIYVDSEGREWFPATELAQMLGYKNPQEAIRKHCKEAGCVFRSVSYPSGTKQKKYVNEGNLYRLLAKSKIKGAEEFESWIFDEVLPMIRRTGMYMTDNVWNQLSNDPTKFGELLIEYGKTKDELKQIKAKNDILMHTEKTYTVTELAKELGVSSAKILNQILSKDQIQYYMNGTWVLYAPYSDKGYTVTKQAVKENSDIPIYYTRWTQLGREFLLNKYIN